MEAIGVFDLLALRGLDRGARMKLVRHQDARYDVHELRRRGWLETYQGFQRRPVFDGLDLIVSFVGAGGRRARFLGVYKVLGSRRGAEAPLPPGCPYAEWLQLEHFYELERVPGFEDLEDRIVIDWGESARAWHQRVRNKEVVELLPKGQIYAPFKDYLDFVLTFGQLQYIYAHETANSEWKARLSAVAGVYLILAATTGAQYIGSAYGAEGIWGRWAAYAKDGHGGNVRLKALLQADAAYPESFSYSLLQIVPRTMTRAEVLALERRYKQKLGSRATGLNDN